MKDAVATMGGILPDDAGGRDAVHVAVFSATCATKTYAGQHVALVSAGTTDSVVSTTAEPAIGVVDPFVDRVIMPGERFWVYLYPRTITSLAHRWGHPAFEDTGAQAYATPASRTASEQWLRSFCGRADVPHYEDLMQNVTRYLNHEQGDEYLTIYGSDASGEIPDEFWHHVATVTGRKINGRARYFSCSC